MPSLIQDLVQHAINTKYLSLEAEERLRQWLRGKQHEREDLHAFMTLQIAAMEGAVEQQSYLAVQTVSRNPQATNAAIAYPGQATVSMGIA